MLFSQVMQRWIERLRAPSTRKMYAHYLKRFLAFHQVTAEESLTWKVDEAEERLEDWKYSLVDKGLAGRTVQNAFGAVRRWFVDHKIRVAISCKDVDTGREYLDYIPAREDVQKLLDDAKLHHMVGIALIAFAGLRPVDAVNLKYENIKNSYEAGDEVLTIVIKQQKTRDWYFTFLGPQGTRYVRQLLTRRKRWEPIADNTPVIAWEKESLSALGLRRAIDRIITRTVGKHPTGESFRVFRPYSLRKYFRRTATRLGVEIAEFLMGHRGGQESLVATYSGLRDMDPQAIAQLKKEYIKLLPELETEITDITLKAQLEEKEKKQQVLQDDLGQMKESIAELREFVKALKEQEDG